MGFVDIHCHVLPGVDDGSRDMDETLEMLKIAQKSGITDMIVTPHYKSGRVGVSRKGIGERIARVEEEARFSGINIRLHPGTEIYYNSSLEEKLESGWLSTLNDTEYVLVEFGPMEPFSYIRNGVDDLFSLGYRPVVAHVERYQCILGNVENVRLLHDMGCGIQVNAGSIAGDYGLRTKLFLKKLLKEQLIDYVGTDAHSSSGNRKPDMSRCAEVIYKKCDREYADSILFGNAQRDFQITRMGEEV